MPKIRCSCFDCKWNSDKNICTYKKELTINDCFKHTVNDGFQHYHICKGYEESEESKTIMEKMKEIFGLNCTNDTQEIHK